MNLQLFADLFPEGHEGVNPLLSDAPAQATEPVEGGSASTDNVNNNVQPQNQQPSFDINSIIEGVRGAIVPSVLEEIRGIIPQQAEPNVVPNEPEEPSGPTPEEIEAINAEWRDKLYENPYAFMQEMQKIADEKAQAKIQPFLDERNISTQQAAIEQEVSKFIAEHDDFHDHADKMVEFFTKYPDLRNMEGVTELAYNYARGQQYSAPQTLDDVLGKEENIEKLSANDKIQKMVVQNYLKGLKEGQPPATFGGKGGAPAPTPSEKPTSIAGASAQLRASYASRGH